MADTCNINQTNIYLLEKIKNNTKTTDSVKHRQKVVLLMELNV